MSREGGIEFGMRNSEFGIKVKIFRRKIFIYLELVRWKIGICRFVAGVSRGRIRRILQKTACGLCRGEHCSPAPRAFRKIGIYRDVRGAYLLAGQLQCPYLLKEILRISLRPTRS